MPLCFLRAFKCWQDGKASDKQFLDYLLAQLRGVRHKDNDIPSIEEPLVAFEPWLAYSRDLALVDDYEPLDDTSAYKEFLALCLEGRSDEFKVALHAACNYFLRPDPLQPAACIAAPRENLRLLRFCLDEGAVFDRHLSQAAEMGARGNIEFFELLLERQWAKIQLSPDIFQDWITQFEEGNMEAQWLREHVGKSVVMKDSDEPVMTGSKGKKKRKGRKRFNAPSTGREPSKGARSRDPQQGYTPQQIQGWFGDVPW